jgi:opacity protein-like surface antigen
MSNSALNSTSNSSGSTEDWKVPGLPPLYHFGAMTGLGVVDSTGGLAVLGTASATVLDKGFVPGVSNSVAVEIEMGPVFAAGATAFWYSVHMRWDFRMDQDWTFYALGGLAGNDTPSSLGGHFEIWPRVGLGTIYAITPVVSLRAEVSHEFMGAGVCFPL